MPLSKAKNRERMRQVRLHKTLERINVQPKYIVRPEIVMLEPTIMPSVTTTDAVGWIDADDNPVYDD